jgi:hypothetical protein
MRMPVSAVLLLFMLPGFAPSYGQNGPAPDNSSTPIVTCRPTVTNSSVVVPDGSFQAKNGFLYTDQHGHRTGRQSITPMI